MKIKVHTIDQPIADIITFILSCNRLDVLEKTISSFLKTRDCITKMVILDDSGEPEIFTKLVEKYGQISDVICFPTNRSQWWAMDFMVSWCDTEYIFYLEDDWELLKPGYLNKSKKILEKYREVGTVDISWRTFEWQGIDSYHKELVDDMFFWKKPWKITDYHAAWYSWVGSPNLKRRDDLVMLGRIEKWHNEWNIDRKFEALGFKGVFLNDKYCEHLGDNCSKMADKRPDDSKTPYDYYPPEVLKNRRAPMINYAEMDSIYEYPADVTLVTGLLDISRNDRSFEEHYIRGLDYLLSVRNPLVVYCEPKYHNYIVQRRKDFNIATSNNRIECRSLTIDDIKTAPHFNCIQQIICNENWKNQSSWIKDSALVNPFYIPLTLFKNKILEKTSEENPMGSKRFYWIDAGIANSFAIQNPISDFNFLFLPKDKFFLTSFPYFTDSEIHGCNINIMSELIGSKPDHVCRATLFGGSKEQIHQFNILCENIVKKLLDKGTIGTEEAVYTVVQMMNQDLINCYHMPNGDIKNYLNTIKGKL